jgi:hypothetical protein
MEASLHDSSWAEPCQCHRLNISWCHAAMLSRRDLQCIAGKSHALYGAYAGHFLTCALFAAACHAVQHRLGAGKLHACTYAAHSLTCALFAAASLPIHSPSSQLTWGLAVVWCSNMRISSGHSTE